MQYDLAPMEGVTGSIYRKTFHECFLPFDRYYTPFISPTSDRRITARQWLEIDPEKAPDRNLIPQLLTNSAELFLWAANELASIGYSQVNLNLGCPSGTVVKKKKGSGLLGQLAMLDAMLNEIYAKTPIPVSIKTRLGLESEEEFDAILDIFNQYPICELIIHPRVQKDMYRGSVRMEAFRKAMQDSRAPICYNGNIFTPADAIKIQSDFPALSGIMLGRGAIANPGLVGYLKEGTWASKEQLWQFHEMLYMRYRSAMPGSRPTLFKLRELWGYMACMFDSPERSLKRIRKANNFSDYEMAVQELFHHCQYLPNGTFKA